MTEDARANPLKSKLIALGVVAMLAGMVVVVVLLFTGETPSPVCDHIAELRKANPSDADAFAEAITAKSPNKVEGTTPDARCRSAWRALDATLEEKEATRLLDCLVHANDARAARECLAK